MNSTTNGGATTPRHYADIVKLFFALLFSSAVTIAFSIMSAKIQNCTAGTGVIWFLQEVKSYFKELGFGAVLFYLATFPLIFWLAKRWWQAKEHRIRKYWLLFCAVCFFWSPVGALAYVFFHYRILRAI